VVKIAKIVRMARIVIIERIVITVSMLKMLKTPRILMMMSITNTIRLT
jgi:hypothetical protein